jgi:hypothetical protein
LCNRRFPNSMAFMTIGPCWWKFFCDQRYNRVWLITMYHSSSQCDYWSTMCSQKKRGSWFEGKELLVPINWLFDLGYNSGSWFCKGCLECYFFLTS